MIRNQLTTRKVSPLSTLFAFTLVVALGCSAQAGAQWTTPDASQNISNTNTGNVGIKTTTPAYSLQINNASPEIFGQVYTGSLGASSGAGVQAFTSATPSAANERMGFYTFGVRSGGAFYNSVALQVFSSQAWTLGGAQGSYLTFSTTPNGSATRTERLRIEHNGNVGIGTSAPATKLHVVGDVTVTGNIAAKYQDLAEWVESSQELTAGTVVVVDPTQSNQVVASTTAYDTRVAGVVSAQPGIVLGEAGANKLLVATTGRVKIIVDTSNAPIEVGDLLVTSSVTGRATKSIAVDVGGVQIHRPGTLIGKALEPLASGCGQILVLLSLQ